MSNQQGPNAVNLRWEAAQMRKEWRERDRREQERPPVFELRGRRPSDTCDWDLGCYLEADLEDAKSKWAAKGYGDFIARPASRPSLIGFVPAS